MNNEYDFEKIDDSVQFLKDLHTKYLVEDPDDSPLKAVIYANFSANSPDKDPKVTIKADDLWDDYVNNVLIPLGAMRNSADNASLATSGQMPAAKEGGYLVALAREDSVGEPAKNPVTVLGDHFERDRLDQLVESITRIHTALDQRKRFLESDAETPALKGRTAALEVNIGRLEELKEELFDAVPSLEISGTNGMAELFDDLSTLKSEAKAARQSPRDKHA